MNNYTNITRKQISNNKLWVATEVCDGFQDRLVVLVDKNNHSRRWEQSVYETKKEFFARVRYALMYPPYPIER